MQSFATSRGGAAIVLALFLLARIPVAGQTQNQPQNRPDDQDELIRVNTELVQAAVTVLDKQGHFVEGLEREHFELKVDGKPQPISFFERVLTGSASEEALLSAARGKSPAAAADRNQARVGLPDRGRVFFFFVDDLHMQADSMMRARKMILQFIEREVGQNDQAVVSSASGQIGFLQQLTDNKTVLRTAAERLKPLPQNTNDMQNPPMSEYLALAIQERHDRDVLELFVEPLLRDGMPRSAAESFVRGRAEQILKQSSVRTRNTLASLDSLVRNAASLPGRKVVYFLSDGFLLRPSETSVNEQMRRLTAGAARSGVVVYTADARGLSTDPSLDAGSAGLFDARASRATGGELSATQEVLRAIAEDTGGRALLNTNAIDAAIGKTVKETSAYYVLAWQPAGDEQKGLKFRRVEVTVKGRPELKVLAQRGFLQRAADESMAKAGAAKTPPPPQDKAKTPAEELRAAISAVYPVTDLPTYLTVNYVDTPQNGIVLTASMSVPFEALALDPAGGKGEGALDFEGHIYNAQGKSGSRFKDRVSISQTTPAEQATQQTSQGRRSVLYNHQVGLAPGLYQVRVAARDARSGRVGGAAEWVEIPDLKSGRLTLGSLQLGERPAQAAAVNDAANFLGQFSPERRFSRDSHLRFLTFIYNASKGAQGAAPDVVLQIQIFRNDQPVVTDELRKVSPEGQDFSRIAYGAEISLASLAVGRYALQVTVLDRGAKTSASQRVNFTVE
ncbi:MAG TPA: VWA domain-containing protein [Pyrinomonadaceae bacterium]|nr:VWA domain-containing protein [Pyrinomonadaceae bacterium]